MIVPAPCFFSPTPGAGNLRGPTLVPPRDIHRLVVPLVELQSEKPVGGGLPGQRHQLRLLSNLAVCSARIGSTHAGE